MISTLIKSGAGVCKSPESRNTESSCAEWSVQQWHTAPSPSCSTQLWLLPPRAWHRYKTLSLPLSKAFFFFFLNSVSKTWLNFFLLLFPLLLLLLLNSWSWGQVRAPNPTTTQSEEEAVIENKWMDGPWRSSIFEPVDNTHKFKVLPLKKLLWSSVPLIQELDSCANLTWQPCQEDVLEACEGDRGCRIHPASPATLADVAALIWIKIWALWSSRTRVAADQSERSDALAEVETDRGRQVGPWPLDRTCRACLSSPFKLNSCHENKVISDVLLPGETRTLEVIELWIEIWECSNNAI